MDTQADPRLATVTLIVMAIAAYLIFFRRGK